MSLHFKLVFILAISTANKQIYTTILNFVDTKRNGRRKICLGQGQQELETVEKGEVTGTARGRGQRWGRGSNEQSVEALVIEIYDRDNDDQNAKSFEN